jgi:two-component system phosphate regulon sensor histidine kinase PhoR
VPRPSDRIDTGLLNAFPDPVILLNIEREVVFANSAAIEMLDNRFENRDLAQSFQYPDVLEAADAVLAGEASQEVNISLPVPVPRNLNVRIIRYAEPASEDGAIALMVFHDVSSETLAEQMRQDFVANLSHELRSPIASLIGFIETLRGPAQDDAKARERFLSIMGDESQRMARMIDDLLSLSRVSPDKHRASWAYRETAGYGPVSHAEPSQCCGNRSLYA